MFTEIQTYWEKNPKTPADITDQLECKLTVWMSGQTSHFIHDLSRNMTVEFKLSPSGTQWLPGSHP